MLRKTNQLNSNKVNKSRSKSKVIYKYKKTMLNLTLIKSVVIKQKYVLIIYLIKK